jgi:hypothetical protein
MFHFHTKTCVVHMGVFIRDVITFFDKQCMLEIEMLIIIHRDKY